MILEITLHKRDVVEASNAEAFQSKAIMIARHTLVATLFMVLTLLMPSTAKGAECEIVLGFKALRDLVGLSVVGECLENEHYNSIGDSIQHTTGGLLVWRKADNWTAFTDGYRTWINGPNGVEQRLNTERFAWEPVPTPTPVPPTQTPAPSPSPTPSPPTVEPALGYALQVMRTTPTGERVYKMFFAAGIRSAQFGPLADYEVELNFTSRTIVINRKYRYESPDGLASKLIRPVVALAQFSESGSVQSWDECFNRGLIQNELQAQWWLEKFGENGKENPTELEQRANGQLSRFLSGILGASVWLSAHGSDLCFIPGDHSGLLQVIDFAPAAAYHASMTSGAAELGKSAVDVIIATGTSVRDTWGSSVDESLPDAWYGYYDISRNTIYITRYLAQSLFRDILASVLIHETYHVEAYHGRGRASSLAWCLEEEIVAFSRQAQWLHERFGPDGIPLKKPKKKYPDTYIQTARDMNKLIYSWLHGILREYVLDSNTYREQCVGGKR